MDTLARGYQHLFDRRDGVSNHLAARWLFLRALGLIYFSAFFALLFQIKGLIGAGGIMPATKYLTSLHALGAGRLSYAPTLFWFGSGNAALMLVCWIGLITSVLVVVNVLPRPALLACFVCFLSFIAVSQDFGQYQSDGMRNWPSESHQPATPSPP